MGNELKTHGITNFTVVNDEIDSIIEEITINGYAVIQSGFSDEKLQSLRDKIDRIYKTQAEEIGGESNLKQINDANVARHLLAYDDEFLDLMTHKGLDEITSRILGDFYVLMSQNALINNPDDDHYQTTWHRDLNYQHFVSTKMIALSALYCIDEFSEKTGGTVILPFTHKVEAFPSTKYIKKHETVVSAPAGSIILFDAMLFHRAGQNTSTSVRRAVNHIFTLPFVVQQISFPKMLGDRFKDNARLRRTLGYNSQIPDSVTEWRRAKLNS